MIDDIKNDLKGFKTASMSQIFNVMMTKIFADDAPVLLSYLGKCKANDPNIIHEINMTNLDNAYSLFHACQRTDADEIHKRAYMHFLSELGRAIERCHLNLEVDQLQGTVDSLFRGITNIKKLGDDALKAALQATDDALGKGSKEVQIELRLAAQR